MSPFTPPMFHAMTQQLITYSLVMTLNVILLWTSSFAANYVLTVFIIVCIFTIVPAIFIQYLLLYIYYNFLDVFTSNSIHFVFKQSKLNADEKFTGLKAENEDISDVENYKEDYLENVVDISTDETSPIAFEDQSEKESLKEKLKIKKKFKFSMRKKSLNNDFAISGNWVNTHLSI